jgi:hypothetical protein
MTRRRFDDEGERAAAYERLVCELRNCCDSMVADLYPSSEQRTHSTNGISYSTERLTRKWQRRGSASRHFPIRSATSSRNVGR